MATYNADLRLNVEISAATKALNKVSDQIDELRKRLNTRFENKSLNEFNDVLARSKRLLNEVEQGTKDETDAVNAYVRALNLANAARERQNQLIARQVAEQRRINPTANAGFGVQGPQLPASAKGMSAGKRAESLALGVGFPLLFGGGPGSVLGAAAGSFVGSGFGGQILGGAIGQILDQFAQGVTKVGSAMRAPIANFKELADANLIAGKAQATYIQKLIEAGKTAEASALIQAEITKKIGVQGMKDLQNAGAASDKLNKAMAELNLQMQAAVAGPLAGFLSWMSSVVRIGNQVGRDAAQQTDILGGLNKKDRASLKAEEARILSGVNLFNESQKRDQVSKLYQRFASRATVPSVSAPGTTVESQQARATTQELQKQVELSRANLSLAGLTLEKDGARYVAAAKNVALQELDNKLLEIKNSWIGKIFDKERNLAMIRSANLEYQAKLQQINAQVGQKAAADQQAQLQLQLALNRQYSDAIAIDIRRVEVEKGVESALERQVKLGLEMQVAALNALDTEREIAVKEAAKNGTLEQTILLFERRRTALENETYINDRINRQKLEQFRIEKDLQSQQRSNQFAQAMNGLQKPGYKTPMEQLLIQQAQNREAVLSPFLEQLNTAQTRLNGSTSSTPAEEVAKYKKEVADATSAIEQLSNALAEVDAAQIAWEKNRVGAQALADVLNGVGTTITNVFTDLITGTENWTNSLNNALGSLANLLLQAGLNSLAGVDGRGFFSILNGTFGRKAANGAYFSNGVAAFGMGGTFANSIVSSPTLFKYAKGGALATGVMGEAGPEAVMPLTRGPNGKLGVSGYGGGGNVSVVVNVDASGSSVQGDDSRANELGRLVSVAVQQELIKQKRPGGVLA